MPYMSASEVIPTKRRYKCTYMPTDSIFSVYTRQCIFCALVLSTEKVNSISGFFLGREAWPLDDDHDGKDNTAINCSALNQCIKCSSNISVAYSAT